MSSMFTAYEAPVRLSKILNEKDIDSDGVILRFLKNPVFAWYDLIIQKGENGEKGKKLGEDYYSYTDPKKRPTLTKHLQVKGYQGKERTVKHLWACLVYNQNTSDIQFFQLTNAYYQEQILSLDKKGYDLLITDLHITKTLKPKTKDEYIYSVTPVPPNIQRELPATINQDITDLNVDLNRIFTTGNPFEAESDEDQFELEDMPTQTAPSPAPNDSDFVQSEPLPDIDLDEITTPF